jgi:hypothetical protein
MQWHRWVCTSLLAAALTVTLGVTQAAAQRTSQKPGAAKLEQARAAEMVPVEQLPAEVREGVRKALEKPTVFTHGPAEAFECDPAVYHWFLDRPDLAVAAWRRLGATCVGIKARGDGQFSWSDPDGSAIVWKTVHRTANLRIWYAEGKVRPAALLPLVPVKSVVVMQHAEGRDRSGGPLMYHQADVFVQTDSAAAKVAAKLFGPGMPRLAEQCVGQLQMFFAGVAWYIHKNPERAQVLLRDCLPPGYTTSE